MWSADLFKYIINYESDDSAFLQTFCLFCWINIYTEIAKNCQRLKFLCSSVLKNMDRFHSYLLHSFGKYGFILLIMYTKGCIIKVKIKTTVLVNTFEDYHSQVQNKQS